MEQWSNGTGRAERKLFPFPSTFPYRDSVLNGCSSKSALLRITWDCLFKGRFPDPTQDIQKVFSWGPSLSSLRKSAPEIPQIENPAFCSAVTPMGFSHWCQENLKCQELGAGCLPGPCPIKATGLETVCRSPHLSELVMWLE